jgi:hypothetical protein
MHEGGCEWHLEFTYAPDFQYPFPIVPAGTRPKHEAVGHLAADGTVHVLHTGIIERLARAGLRMRGPVPKQAQSLNIPPTKSLLFRDMAFEIEAAMREQDEEKR